MCDVAISAHFSQLRRREFSVETPSNIKHLSSDFIHALPVLVQRGIQRPERQQARSAEEREPALWLRPQQEGVEHAGGREAEAETAP